MVARPFGHDRPILCLVTSSNRLVGAGAGFRDRLGCLCAQASRAAEAGIDLIQVREPHLAGRELEALVAAIVEQVGTSGTRVVVNERLDVALACGAHGVHLREDGVPAARARAMVPSGFLVGCSVHSADAARAAEASVDYLVAGTVFDTVSKPPGHPTLGPSGLAGIVSAVAVPVLAIGGITPERAPLVWRAGAAGLAAIGIFMKSGAEGVAAVVPLHEMRGRLANTFDSRAREPRE